MRALDTISGWNDLVMSGSADESINDDLRTASTMVIRTPARPLTG
jgi:hypothetical protein